MSNGLLLQDEAKVGGTRGTLVLTRDSISFQAPSKIPREIVHVFDLPLRSVAVEVKGIRKNLVVKAETIAYRIDVRNYRQWADLVQTLKKG